MEQSVGLVQARWSRSGNEPGSCIYLARALGLNLIEVRLPENEAQVYAHFRAHVRSLHARSSAYTVTTGLHSSEMLSRFGRPLASASRQLGSIVRLKHTLPALPYAYNALEPVISAEIMELHHSKHHATYVNNLNIAEEQLKEFVDKGEYCIPIKAHLGARRT